MLWYALAKPLTICPNLNKGSLFLYIVDILDDRNIVDNNVTLWKKYVVDILDDRNIVDNFILI